MEPNSSKVKRKHICIISHGCRKNDGQSHVNYEIVKAVIRENWQVTFIGTHISEELMKEPLFNWINIRRSVLPSNLINSLVFSIKSTVQLRRHIKDYDVVHANGFVMWSRSHINSVHFVHSAWLGSRFYPYKKITSLYSLYQLTYTWFYARLEKLAFKRAGMLVAVSQKIKDEIVKTGVGESRISVIHNGVDVDEFASGQPKRRKFSIPEDKVIFLFAGDIRTPRKNLDSVLKAMTIVPEIHLAVAGKLESSPYPALAQSLGLAERVHFLGFIYEMPALMKSVDAFVFPSRYEACCLVLFEAMASSLPVITAASAGGSEVVGGAGIVIPDPEDINRLAEALHCLATDEKLRDAKGIQARETAIGLSTAQMTQKYLNFYRKFP